MGQQSKRFERRGTRLVLALLVPCLACTVVDPRLDPLSGVELAQLRSAPPPPPGRNWPLSPERLEVLLGQSELQVLSMERTSGGNTGAQKVQLSFPDGTELTAKWKLATAGDADAYNDAPRKELAAYRIQQLFLDPENYVVPTLALRCLPLETLRRFQDEARPTFRGGRCALGTLSVWLEDVHVPEKLDDRERFARDANYAFHLANFDVLTKLIDHDDAKRDNFLASNDRGNQRFFAVDNGIAFGDRRHNYMAVNWDGLRVPALPEGTAERLRRIGNAELEALSVVAELRKGADGMLHAVAPTPPRDRGRGSRHGTGWLQLGLTRSEIEGVRRRLADIRDELERGDIGEF